MIKAAAVVALALGSAAVANTVVLEIEPAAVKLMHFTRNTQATYSVYTWNVITPPGGTKFEEWSAEFHQGNLHRVETPRDRVIADCRAMTATHLNVADGEISSGEDFAKLACGIADKDGVASAKMLPSQTGRFGPVKRMRVADGHTVRTYSVDRSGIIVQQTISELDGHLDLSMYAVTVKDTVPLNIFTADSLSHSAVPPRFRTKPAPHD